jgi:hypothetical protein
VKLIIAGIFGIVAAVIGAGFSYYLFSSGNQVVDAEIKLVDLILEEIEARDSFDLLEKSRETNNFDNYKLGSGINIELKLRNIGDKVAFLKQANFEVKKVHEFNHFFCHFSLAQVSSNYDVILPPDDFPYDKKIKLSQQIPPDGVDRFTFTIGTNSSEFADYVYIITPSIIYNEKNDLLKLPEMVLFFQGGTVWHGATSCDDPEGLVSEHNRNVIMDIIKNEGIKSETITKIENNFLENQS